MVFDISWYGRNKNTYEGNRRIRSWRLRTRYGISLEDFESLFDKQQGRCGICKEEKKLHVDHCHSTGKVRGLLCYTCNNGLGSFKDSSENLKKAIQWLEGL